MPEEARSIVNPAKQALKDGKSLRVFNVFESLRPSVVKVIAQSGYDMLLVETEHILHNPETITMFLTLARDNGLSPAVTIQTVTRPIVSRLLDAGAMGICLSHSETPEQVEELVQWMKYPPVGERALAHGPSAEYLIDDHAAYCAEANDATLLIIKIESRKGLENAEAMISNPNVDAVVFGPGDFAADMGIHGKMDHPDLVGAMEQVVELALANGKAVEAPVYATSRAEYEAQRARGIQIFGPIRTTEYDQLRQGASQAISAYLPG